jgi:hypothetical protein
MEPILMDDGNDVVCSCSERSALFTFRKEEGKLYLICNDCGYGHLINDLHVSGLPNTTRELREDELVRARMEAQHDSDADPEGGDLYDDRDNPEMPCPMCGSFCAPWDDDNQACDGFGDPASEEDNDDFPLSLEYEEE